jgi:hypothetical protein
MAWNESTSPSRDPRVVSGWQGVHGGLRLVLVGYGFVAAGAALGLLVYRVTPHRLLAVWHPAWLARVPWEDVIPLAGAVAAILVLAGAGQCAVGHARCQRSVPAPPVARDCLFAGGLCLLLAVLLAISAGLAGGGPN